MADRQHGYCVRVFDAKKRHVTGVPEWDDKLSQEWVAIGLATGKRRKLKQAHRLADCALGTASGRCILIDQKVDQAQQVVLSVRREADGKAHHRARTGEIFDLARTSRSRSLRNTSVEDT
jgi:hypothetical protein